MRKIWMFLIILFVFIYFIFPYDLIPDFFGLFGRLDDFSLLGWLIWFVRRQLLKQKGVHYTHNKRNAYQQYQSSQSTNYQQTNNSDKYKYGNSYRNSGDTNSEEKEKKENKNDNDPYTILNINRNATEDEIKGAYKELIKKYHPDKVAHLGEEFQQIAHKKMINIQKAYEILKK